MGAPAGQAFWSQVERDFLSDLETTLNRIGAGLDLIFVTGDIAFDGKREQYDRFDRFIDRLQRPFGTGEEPFLFTVPGNHDFRRPQGESAYSYAVLDFYRYDQHPLARHLKQSLWQEKNPSLLQPPFSEYVSWRSRRNTREFSKPAVVDTHVSYFPGDMSVVLEKNGFRLALVGLNSAWMQHSDENFEGRLEISREQLQASLPPRENVFDLLPGQGSDSADQALLLMHHPMNWLSEQAKTEFRQSIYPDGRQFALALYGHQHEGRSEVTAISGGSGRRFYQGASLFGLEHYGTATEERSFGYSLGRITRDGEVVVWPRVVVSRASGALKFDVDTSFDERLDDGSILLRQATVPAVRPRRSSPSGTYRSTTPASGGGLSTSSEDDIAKEELLRFRDWSLRLHARSSLIGIGANDFPFSIEEIYIPLRVVASGGVLDLKRAEGFRGRAPSRMTGETIELSEVFVRAEGRDILLFGEPGAGKTMALRKILHQTWLEGGPSLGLAEGTVPLLLRLRSMTQEQQRSQQPLLALIEKELDATSGGVWNAEFAGRLWRRGRLLLLLDGLDEIPDSGLRADVCGAVARSVAALRGQHIRAVVSCRYSGFTPDIRYDGELTSYDLLSLDDVQITAFLERWFGAARAALERDPTRRDSARLGGIDQARQLANELNAVGVDPGLRMLVTTPLFLTLLSVVCLRKGQVPPRRVDFFRECIQTLLGSWPRERGIAVRWTDTDALSIMRPLALAMHRRQVRELSRTEILGLIHEEVEWLRRKLGLDAKALTAEVFLDWAHKGSGLLVQDEEQQIGFSHLALQEYLAAAEIAAHGRTAITELAQNFGVEWWTEVILLAVALPDHRVFEPLVQAVVAGNALPSAAELMVRVVREAHEARSSPFLPVLEDETQPSAKRAAILRALLDRADTDVVRVATKLIAHPDPDLHFLADRLVQLERREAEADSQDGHAAGANASQQTIVEPNTGIRLLPVPGGRLIMGDKELAYASPEHRVRLASYWLAETPVTNAQYLKYTQATGQRNPRYAEDRRFGSPNQPVVAISWDKATAFCEWLATASGLDVRLPTEAQWEFAARGPNSYRYPWGDEKPDATRAHFGLGTGIATAEVGSHPAGRGPFKHLDLAGNVAEWCRDVWNSEIYAARARAGKGESLNPEVASGDASRRCLRGGCVTMDDRALRSATRGRSLATTTSQDIGFRVAVIPPKP
jgi:formylglycine-generating enzyme required for sulfatase activity